MTHRYIPLAIPRKPRPPKAEIDWDTGGPAFMTVHEDDDSPVHTGVLDHNGLPVYRVPQKVTMGFVSGR